MEKMREIRIEKMTLNIGVGKNPALLDKGVMLLKQISGMTPFKAITQKRIAGWGIRPGLAIGCKVTIREPAKVKELLIRLLQAKDNVLTAKQFDENGNIAFGIHEYINIPGVNYDPKIGIIGLQACLTLARPGFRIKKRKNQKRKIPLKHKITKEDALEFMKTNYNVQIGEKDDN
ncbi:MAG: 50S ribosomal protein L5 [Nanoarchaeota archaeon]|nr:50S ribosomal protein L5 [Nanoarchaeota archaeon]